MTFWAFILRRAARHWQILLTLSLGVILSTAMLASSPVLVNTVVEFGLRRTLLAADPSISDLRLKAFGRLTPETYAELDSQVQQVVNGRIPSFTDQVVPVIGSRWFHPWVDGTVLPAERVNFRSYGSGDTDIRQFVTLVAGEWPSDPLPEPGVAAVVIGEELAEADGLAIVVVQDRAMQVGGESGAGGGLQLEIVGRKSDRHLPCTCHSQGLIRRQFKDRPQQH